MRWREVGREREGAREGEGAGEGEKCLRLGEKEERHGESEEKKYLGSWGRYECYLTSSSWSWRIRFPGVPCPCPCYLRLVQEAVEGCQNMSSDASLRLVHQLLTTVSPARSALPTRMRHTKCPMRSLLL